MSKVTDQKSFVSRSRPASFSPSVEVAACYIKCQGKYLFLMRSKGKLEEHKWGVPAGKIESGESAHEAAIRETFEESGVSLEAENVSSLGKLYISTSAFRFVYHMFHCEVADFPSVILNDEHEDYRWVTYDEAIAMPLLNGAEEALCHARILSAKPDIPRKEFYFIRHGATGVNPNPLTKEEDDDLPLNEAGRQQANAARNIVATLPINSVYFSPALRTKETKEVLFEGKNILDKEVAEIGECKAHVWTNMCNFVEGTCCEQIDEVMDFMHRIKRGVYSTLEGTGVPLLVAHGGLHWTLCYHMMIENHPWCIGNCEVVHFYPVGSVEWGAKVLSRT